MSLWCQLIVALALERACALSGCGKQLFSLSFTHEKNGCHGGLFSINDSDLFAEAAGDD